LARSAAGSGAADLAAAGSAADSVDSAGGGVAGAVVARDGR
jgi:hypothetical protein